MEEYKKVNKNIEELKAKIKQYDDLINSSENNYSSDLTFKEKYVIYTMIKNVLLKGKEKSYFGMDLSSLKARFEYLYDDLREYLSITEKIKKSEESRSNIINENISFNYFGSEHYSDHCLENHCLVVDGKELKCVYCGATTKDYPLSNEEFEFLVFCAK